VSLKNGMALLVTTLNNVLKRVAKDVKQNMNTALLKNTLSSGHSYSSGTATPVRSDALFRHNC